ncbi:MAG: acyl carrier protein [Lachnospiraceae bacterium]|nr:acyl carrier protein [Lachnospiraceae bacterium]
MLEKLTELIVEKLDVEAEKVTAETSFKEDLEIDSLDLFDLVMNVEEAFGVEIPSEDLEGIKTVGDMVAYLEAHGAN